MSRFRVHPISPGSCVCFSQSGPYYNDLGMSVKEFKTAKGAKNYAEKHANYFSYGLVVVDSEREKIDWGGSEKIVWEDLTSS